MIPYVLCLMGWCLFWMCYLVREEVSVWDWGKKVILVMTGLGMQCRREKFGMSPFDMESALVALA
ncbi:hypothetical protein QJS10_CPB18g01101 [Acorus calamus]|uniref:Uncharacterized protein n=1 Tax=Acorus calamus TaxID=4465 RepID=A0AAV9CL05_ACOCL|nr:hypothetical protein QJS10_CPB18g01101 [Acorus calamus]